MRVLLLVNVVPYPPHGGVHLRIYNLLKRMARTHEITLGCHSWTSKDEEHAAELTRQGIRTVTGRLTAANWRHLLPAFGAMLRGDPLEVAQYQSPVLHDLVRNEQFDILHVEETLLTPYRQSLPRDSKSRTVLTLHNIHFEQARRMADIEKDAKLRWWRRQNSRSMRKYEPKVAARFDRVITVSDVDRKLLQSASPGLPVDVIPNGVDTQEMELLPEPLLKRTLLFVGSMDYRPCIDAAEYLVNDILPLVRQSIPDAEVWIVGKYPNAEVEALAGKGVFVTGWVPDTRPYYERAAVAVVPLRAGGGSRLKILEAMSLGRPVVSTAIGAEGIEARDGQEILLAEDAQAIANQIIRVLQSADEWKSLVRNARQFVEQHHDWDDLAETQLRLYETLAE